MKLAQGNPYALIGTVSVLGHYSGELTSLFPDPDSHDICFTFDSQEYMAALATMMPDVFVDLAGERALETGECITAIPRTKIGVCYYNMFLLENVVENAPKRAFAETPYDIIHCGTSSDIDSLFRKVTRSTESYFRRVGVQEEVRDELNAEDFDVATYEFFTPTQLQFALPYLEAKNRFEECAIVKDLMGGKNQ